MEDIDKLEQDIKEMFELSEWEQFRQYIKEDIAYFGKKLIDMESAYQDSMRANAAGLQNVYDKFVQLESRQEEIEKLLNSEVIKNYIDIIPEQSEIQTLIYKLEGADIGKMFNTINELRADFEDFRSLFNF